jgi:hypothetical protein
MNNRNSEFTLSTDLARLLQVLVALGALVFAAGLVLAPERIWPSLLLVSYFVLCLGLGGVVFIAFHYITGATWGIAVRRVPEAMSTLIPVGAIGLLAVFIFHPSIYPWTSAAHAPVEAAAWFKHFWLQRPFFIVRAMIYLLLWLGMAAAFVRNSYRQDQDRDPKHTRSNERLAAIFLAVFGISFWLASYDWIMSLEPEWYSTIFGIYHFAGLFASGVAAIIVFTVALKKLGPFEGVLTADHLHDLGKLLFAFSTFWAYIWFSQYMLIWYTDIPEEARYYVARMHGNWGPLFLLNFMLNWTLPFLALLPRATKRTPSLLVKVAVLVLLGRWLDLYLMINPPSMGAKPSFGAWEFGLMLGTVGLCGLVVFRALRRAAPVPVGDPWLADSLHHHQ